jgi:hypothetical protein
MRAGIIYQATALRIVQLYVRQWHTAKENALANAHCKQTQQNHPLPQFKLLIKIFST